jgi:hypothetical protein
MKYNFRVLCPKNPGSLVPIAWTRMRATRAKTGRSKRAIKAKPMLTLLRYLVMSLAALVEKAFMLDPHYIPRERHLTRFARAPKHKP